jgi:hypothetical protein
MDRHFKISPGIFVLQSNRFASWTNQNEESIESFPPPSDRTFQRFLRHDSLPPERRDSVDVEKRNMMRARIYFSMFVCGWYIYGNHMKDRYMTKYQF